MNLWDIIRDWFVQYVFGGVGYNTSGSGAVVAGSCYYESNGEFFQDAWTTEYGYVCIPNVWTDDAGFSTEGAKAWITLGDYLSTTATIIVQSS